MTSGAHRITSQDNAHFKALLRLQQSSRERRKKGWSLLDGAHLVGAYLLHAGMPEQIVVAESALKNAEIASLLSRCSVAPLMLSDALFRALSSVSSPTGIMAVVNTPRAPAVPVKPGSCVMLEDIQDPGNLGSIFRSAAAAGVEEVYLSNACVQAWSPRVLRAGMGAHFALSIFEGVDLQALVGSYEGAVLATAREAATSLYETDLRGRVALLFGNEGAGLSPELQAKAHRTICIPMPGKAESLNVAAAAAVCLFERVRQLMAVTRT